MPVLIRILAVLVFLLYSSVNPSATDLWQSLQDYFNDSAIQFDYDSGPALTILALS